MNRKKTLALCLATCATIFTSIPVYANNYTDSNLPEKYIGYNNYVDTKLRHTYSQCRLSICTNVSGVTTTLHGKWSPDSIGSYPIANP